MGDKSEQLDLAFVEALETAGLDESELRRRTELAIGEYLARKRRIWSEMPIARLMRALERQGIPSDLAPRALELIGATVVRVPEYVAKYNYRVTFSPAVLDRCRQAYHRDM